MQRVGRKGLGMRLPRKAGGVRMRLPKKAGGGGGVRMRLPKTEGGENGLPRKWWGVRTRLPKKGEGGGGDYPRRVRGGGGLPKKGGGGGGGGEKGTTQEVVGGGSGNEATQEVCTPQCHSIHVQLWKRLEHLVNLLHARAVTRTSLLQSCRAQTIEQPNFFVTCF